MSETLARLVASIPETNVSSTWSIFSARAPVWITAEKGDQATGDAGVRRDCDPGAIQARGAESRAE